MSDKKQDNDSQVESEVKNFLRSPLLQAVSILLIVLFISLSILAIQYYQIQSLAESSRSQASVINDEYNRFKNTKNSYETFINDVARTVLAKKPALGSIEYLYTKHIINDINLIADSSIFRGNEFGEISLPVTILSSRVSILIDLSSKYMADMTEISNKVKTEIVDSLLNVANQEKATYTTATASPLTQQLKSQELISIYKINTMLKSLKFAGQRSSIGSNKLIDTTITIMNNYNPSLKTENNLYPYRDIVKMSFELFVTKGAIQTVNDLKTVFPNKISKNVFGEYFSSTNYENLITRINMIHNINGISERIEKYNVWIVQSLYPTLNNPHVVLEPLSLERVDKQNP